MIYVENIFACLIFPLLIAVFLVKGEIKRFIGFFTLGLTICLLSSYVSSFVAAILADNGHASLTITQSLVQITPICEEVLKALPIFFFVAMMKPEREDIVSAAFAVGLGFATFENCCYISLYQAADFPIALARGLSTGVMHIICAAILGYGMALIHQHRRLAVPGAFALLCASSTFHAIYNLLSAADGAWRTAGYLLPLVSVAGILLSQIIRRPIRA